MTVQDDAREFELVRLFNLTVPGERKRSDLDAMLRADGLEIPFELKSTTGGSISTVRDFGPDHIAKWKNLHWIFGFYSRGGTPLLHCHYASPARMAPWIEQMERYIRPDIILANHAPELVTESMLLRIFGDRTAFTLDDAKRIQKKQYDAAQYRERMDLPNGYSQQRMLEMLQDRCRYVIRRGSTLNNPHIPQSYFAGWERIVENHAIRLRELVREALGTA
ncbi:MAG: hypothetical protein ACRD0K_30060 [Egibacteraceae bacterium]